MAQEPIITKLPAADKLNALTGIRFFAALAIVFHHLSDFGFQTPGAFASTLHMGVSLFFVLSGFVLAHVYPRLQGPAELKRFFVARFARIWPGHIAALVLLYILLMGQPGLLGTGQDTFVLGLANIFLVHAWIPLDQFFFGYNSVSWSISVEVFFYLAFPFLISRLHATWAWKIASCFAVSILLLALAVHSGLPSFQNPGQGLTLVGLICFNPLARLYEFVVGMTVAVFFSKMRDNCRVPFITASTWEILSIALVVLAASWLSGHDVWLNALASDAVTTWIQKGNLLAPIFAGFIFILAIGRGIVSMLIGSKGFVWLGEISYMIYLTHQIILRVYGANRGWFSGWPESTLLPTYFVAVVAVSALLWRFVERPMRRVIMSCFLPKTEEKPAPNFSRRDSVC